MTQQILAVNRLSITFLGGYDEKTVLMVIATVMLVLAGCSNNSSADTKESTAAKDKSEVTIQDANGKITVPKAPKK